MRRSGIVHLLTRKPFKPFRVTVSTDESFDIRHPEAAYLAKRFMAVAKSGSEAFRDDSAEMVWIDYRHIVHCHPVSKKTDLPF
jgi:hypothetical protein